MRLITVSVWMILFLWTVPLSARTNYNYEHYIKLSERCFDAQNFDSCVYYNYILAHYYTQNHDTAGIVNAWYNIGIINLLQKKPTRAQAAKMIANRYITRNAVDNDDLKNIYYNLLNHTTLLLSKPLKILPGFKNLASLRSKHLRKLYYLPQLYKATYDYRNNQFTQAKASLQQLIRTMKAQRDTNWFGYAKANMLMGECYYAVDDYMPCFAYYETAIRIYEVNQIYRLDFNKTYRHYLYSLLATGQGEKRDFYFQKIEKNNLINKNRSSYYSIKGNFIRFTSNQEALEAYLQGYYSVDADVEIRNDLNMGIISSYVLIGQYDLAKAWLNKLDTSGMDGFDKAWIAYNCGKLGNIAMGTALIKKETERIYYVKEILYYLGQFYAEIKNFDKAEKYFGLYKGCFLKTNSNDNYSNMKGFSDLGYFYWYGMADYKKSLEYYHKAVFELIHTHAPNDYYQIPDINQSISDKDLARELENKGEAFFEVSQLQKNEAETVRDLKASLAYLELAMTVAHRYKMSLSRDEQRYLYADGIQHWYLFLINVCLELYRKTTDPIYTRKAFEYSEKSKSSLLLSTMRGVNARNMHLLPENFKNAEDQIWTRTELISNNLSELYHATNINRKKIDQYNAQLILLRHQKDSLLHVFKEQYPAYYNARYKADVIAADSLQKLLKPNEAILEYAVSNHKIVIYLITLNDFKIFTNTAGKSFFSDVEAYRKQLSDYSFEYRDSLIRGYATMANRLYNLLIKPAEPYIKGKKLLIIPDDVLTQIPFETLVTKPIPEGVQASYKTLSYLIKEHVVYYNYSGTLYAMNRSSFTYHQAKLLGVAPKYENKTFNLNANDTSILYKDSTLLSPIPWALDEVKGIHKMFGGKTLSGGHATEARFKAVAGKYDILHLAAHGIVNNENPMFSKLVFTEQRDSVNGGFLNTYEIYDMHINAPLIVLSACNTGYGQLHKGEGIISLARGFFTAGAKSIVMTLWAVSDKISSVLMQNFYVNLATNQNIGDAMQKAKIQYLEQTNELGAHPFFWAGYIVLGNASNSFESIPPKPNYLLWSAGGLVILMLWIVRKKIQSRVSTYWTYRKF